MHPMVKPALRRGWRDLNTVQFGMAPAHAMVVGPVDTATGSLLGLLDGTRGLPLLRDEGRRMGLPDGHVDTLVERLSASGLLDDAKGGGPEAADLRERKEVLDRLRPDLASLLAGAGVGEVDVRDIGRVEPWDVAPGGFPAESVGERRDEAARRAVRRAAPDRPPGRRAAGSPGEGCADPGLDLVVLAPRDGLAVHAPDPAAVEPLLASGTPHLYAGVVEGTGVVGPLVVPGETACADCLDRHRRDRDETWPRLVAQWRSGRPRPGQACDLALASAVASLAAGHALTFLDGETPASAGARWEAAVPRFDWHARPVWAHPGCPCGAARKDGSGDGAEGRAEEVEKGNRARDAEDGGSRATMAVRQPSAEVSRKAPATRLSRTWRAHV
nr:TOMM precursor leader peptide-binding protein [Streptomyces sp. MH191]MCF0100901.1 hypothetical protein [Streptomyces sp. MH191]